MYTCPCSVFIHAVLNPAACGVASSTNNNLKPFHPPGKSREYSTALYFADTRSAPQLDSKGKRQFHAVYCSEKKPVLDECDVAVLSRNGYAHEMMALTCPSFLFCYFQSA